MTKAEREAFNAGVMAMITSADRSAKAIAGSTRRPLVEGFAIAALDELAQAGRDLLLPSEPVVGVPGRGAAS